jgi:hypothetical protein
VVYSRYNHGICLMGLKNATKYLSQDSRCHAEIRSEYLPNKISESYHKVTSVMWRRDTRQSVSENNS